MRFTHKPFGELTGRQVYDHLALRQRVFVVEQACVYLDCDGHDPRALHLWAEEPGGATVAYARLFAPGDKYAEASVGRVVVAPELRGRGAGRALFAEALRVVHERYGSVAVRIQAQAHLRRFYEAFGFVVTGDEYLEDGIPHLDMVRPAAS
jgi:ElaA protein